MMNFPLLASANTFRLNIRSVKWNITEIKHFVFFKQNSASQLKYRHDILISISFIFYRKTFDFFFLHPLSVNLKNHWKILKNHFFAILNIWHKLKQREGKTGRENGADRITSGQQIKIVYWREIQ